MIYAAVLAGGIGKRVERATLPKQFIKIGGTPIIIRTLRGMLPISELERIYVAVHPDWLDYARTLFLENFSAEENKRICLVSGGKERFDSFANVVAEIDKTLGIHDDDILICHEAVRPFATAQMFEDCIAGTKKSQLALTCVPATDTMFISKEPNLLTGTLNRAELFNGQNPSGFNLKLLKEICDNCSAEEKSKSTGTMQLFLNRGRKIEIVRGHTSNFKITTDADLDVAERMVKTAPMTKNIELLDCTLRDGGIVFDFSFGHERMQTIKKTLEDAGTEFIECGYIDAKKGTELGRSCWCDEKAIEKNFLFSGKKPGVNYVAMIDFGTFDVNKLGERTGTGIDGIRFAFHKDFCKKAIEQGKIIISKGYDLYVQPMVSLRYSDVEFRELIESVNREIPETKAFYIVDSFGQMNTETLVSKFNIAETYVLPSTKIGFHAHNNRQLAFSNALAFINSPSQHTLMLDSSIMGMGKGAGNLCTELIIPMLPRNEEKYNTLPIYNQISEYFSKMMVVNPWGYNLDFYLSSIYNCTPSYIKIFKSDSRVTTEILIKLLKGIPENKLFACDKTFAAEHLKSFFENESK